MKTHLPSDFLGKILLGCYFVDLVFGYYVYICNASMNGMYMDLLYIIPEATSSFVFIPVSAHDGTPC